MARMPTYYVMDLGQTMAQTVAPEMPSSSQVQACQWLRDDDLAVYAAEYRRNGFQGGLQGYRVSIDARCTPELGVFSGRTIDVPACFIAGARDWGSYQAPGALERMAGGACTRYAGTHFVEGAGHWVQQERPQEVNRLLGEFLRRHQASAA